MNALSILRILLGIFFVISGGEKLLSPYQNFLYVVQNYQLLPSWAEAIVAHAIPWAEFILGVFLTVGLWLRWTLKVTLVLISIFIVVVGQAMIRKLPIDECGCFGEFIHLPLYGVLLSDSILGVITVLLLFKLEKTSTLSLDRYFVK